MLRITTTVEHDAPYQGSDPVVIRATRPGGRHQRFSLVAADLGAFLRRVRIATIRDGRVLTRERLAEEINGRKPADEPRISAGIIARGERGGHVRGIGFVHLHQITQALGLTIEIHGARRVFRAPRRDADG